MEKAEAIDRMLEAPLRGLGDAGRERLLAARRLALANFGIKVTPVGADLTAANIYELPGGAQPTCETAGVLNSVPAVVAAIQVADALKTLCAGTASVRARITTVDVWSGELRANEFALRFFVPPYEMTVFPDGRAIIKGTTDVGAARSLYARYIGS